MTEAKRQPVPEKTVERLVLYRRLLETFIGRHVTHFFSHELAALANNSPAQVRRDLMIIGFSGSTGKGYPVQALLRRIKAVFREKEVQQAALVGLGRLGRAILSHLRARADAPRITEVFDRDARKIGTTYDGCVCRDIGDLPAVVGSRRITLGLITVPAPAAQQVADLLIIGGVQGLLNFASCPLKVPARVYLEQVDIAAKLKRIAFFCD